MYELPDRLKSLIPYQPITGEYSVRLDANESFLDTPDWLREEIAAAIKKIAFHRYPDPLCTELREKFAAFFHIDPQLVTAGNGSDELIGLIINTFLGPGEKMAMVRPDFSMYSIYAEIAGVPTAVYEKEPDSLELERDDLISFVKESGAKLLIFSNPCNPTSQKATIEDMIQIIESLDCLVVADEAYMDFSEGSILHLAQQYDNLILLKTCSKIGMAGIRLGFAVANPALTRVLQAVRSPYNVNAMTQAAGCIWFSHGDYIRSCVEQIKASRNALCRELAALGEQKKEILQVLPSYANFVFLHMAHAKSVFENLARQGIAVRLMGEYLRITAGSEMENKQLLTALEEILK